MARAITDLRGEGERFAEAQEVIGLIRKADEAAGQAADAARQTDGLFAFLFDLQIDVHRAGFLIALDLGVFGLERLEIIELVEAQQADFPEPVVEEIAFVEKYFAANDLVARGGIAGEFDAADEELLLLVEFQGQVDDLLVFHDVENRLGGEIDVAVLTVELLIVVESLAQLLGRKNVALVKRKNFLEEVRLEE